MIYLGYLYQTPVRQIFQIRGLQVLYQITQSLRRILQTQVPRMQLLLYTERPTYTLRWHSLDSLVWITQVYTLRRRYRQGTDITAILDNIYSRCNGGTLGIRLLTQMLYTQVICLRLQDLDLGRLAYTLVLLYLKQVYHTQTLVQQYWYLRYYSYRILVCNCYLRRYILGTSVQNNLLRV